MRHATILAALAACALPAHAAAAITTSDGSDPAPFVALLGHSYMPLPATFVIVPSDSCPYGPPPQPLACADSTLRLYASAKLADPSVNGVMVMTHETGHLVDFTIRARDGGATDRAFDQILTAAGVTTGSRLEQFADTWAECSIEGPTADPSVFTPDYNFEIPAAAYAQACDLFRSATEGAGDFTAAPATYQGAPWRKVAQPGDCMSGVYVVACPQPVVAKPRPRAWRWRLRWARQWRARWGR